MTSSFAKQLLLTGLLILSLAHAGEIEEGIQHFKNGEYEKAAVLTQSRQSIENPEAQYYAGILHRDGLGGVEKHEDIALWWLEKAAVQQYVPAQYALAQLHAKNKHNHSRLQKAYYRYEQAAKNGHPVSQYKMAEHVMDTWERTPKQTRDAINWYELAARNGQADAANKLASFYEHGLNIPKDDKQARYWAQTSANLNNPEGMALLGNFYINGIGGPFDVHKGAELIMQAAQTGHSRAQFQLAEYYRNIDRTPDHEKRAMDWYAKAALKNHAESIRRLVSIHQFGLMSQPVNKQEAEKWQYRLDEMNGTPSSWIKKLDDMLNVIYRYLWLILLLPIGLLIYAFRPHHKEAVNIGQGMLQFEKGQYETAFQLLNQTSIWKHPQAQTLLGKMYANGLGVKKDINKAMQNLTHASSSNSHAAFLLGMIFEKGDGVEKAQEKAIYWYKKSAELDDEHAANRLGIFYVTGHGVKKDPQKACEYFKKSVKSGLFEANANLAWLFHCGIGVPKDDFKAFRLTSKCAAKKCPAAQYNLAVSYRYGFGTVIDHARAMKWYRQSALCGQQEAILALIDILKNGLLGERINLKEIAYWREEAKNIHSVTSHDYLIYPENPAFA